MGVKPNCPRFGFALYKVASKTTNLARRRVGRCARSRRRRALQPVEASGAEGEKTDMATLFKPETTLVARVSCGSSPGNSTNSFRSRGWGKRSSVNGRPQPLWLPVA